MSAVSSQLSSFRSSPPWKISARLLNIMDSIYAIGFGLGLRALIDAVSQNFKLTGSLIGLWEGVVTLHFLKKMPKSSDPYIAFGVRLFVDFIVTESVERLVLVLIWTAFGMVLADVTPAIWDEVGLKRVWRHLRRDLYTIYDRIPTVAFFPPPRTTVRFLPSREPSIISPSITTSQNTPIAVVPPSSSIPPGPLKRRVPGHFPGDYSDTDTDLSIRTRPSPRTEVNDALVSDLDDGNRSSAASSSDSTEMGDPPSFDQENIPDMEEHEQEQVLVDIKESFPDPTTPKQKPKYIPMPPTPSDSAARWEIRREVVEPPRQHQEFPVDMPDSIEDGGTSDGWVKVPRGEVYEDKAPTPPAKDKPAGSLGVPIIPIPVPPVAMRDKTKGSTNANPFAIDFSAFDDFSTFQAPGTTTEPRRRSGPPPYVDPYDDMYYNPPPRDNKPPTTNVNESDRSNKDNDDNNLAKKMKAEEEEAEKVRLEEEDERVRLGEAERVRQEEEAERVRQEEVERVRQEEEVERVRLEEEEAKRIRLEEEEAERVRNEKEDKKKKIAEEKAERVRLEEAEAGRVRTEKEDKKKKIAEEKAERVRLEEEEAKRIRLEEEEAERVRLEEEEAERVRKEKEDKKKKIAEEKAERKRKEEEDNALRKVKQAEAAAEEKKRREEAEQEAEAAKQKKKEEKAAEQKRKDDEAAKQKRKNDEVAEQKRKDDEAAEQKRKEEAAELKRKDDEIAEQKRKGCFAQKEQEKKMEEADRAAEAEGGQAMQDNDDDSKTLHNVDLNTETQQEPSINPNLLDNPTLPLYGDPTEEESATSEVSAAPPAQAKERLERVMTLRAQMVELEKRLEELWDQGYDEQSPEMKAVQKSLRKFQRQAERRYAAGIQLAQNLNGLFDEGNDISLEGMHPKTAELILEEKLEELLAPTSRSIHFSLTITKKASEARKQKPNVLSFLNTYNLIRYTVENEANKKISYIDIPEEKFAEWLTGYRALVAKRSMEDEGDDDPWQNVY